MNYFYYRVFGHIPTYGSDLFENISTVVFALSWQNAMVQFHLKYPHAVIHHIVKLKEMPLED